MRDFYFFILMMAVFTLSIHTSSLLAQLFEQFVGSPLNSKAIEPMISGAQQLPQSTWRRPL